MLILALDTTATTATCAVLRDRAPVAVYTQNGNLTHSETMLHMIENMLKNAHMTIDMIDLFAVSAGPGSFTGVRIGVSIVKGLAFGRKKPCIGVSTLDALAAEAAVCTDSGVIVPVMDARRSQVYTALYAVRQGKLEKLTDDLIITAKELDGRIRKTRKMPTFVGDGCPVIEKELPTTEKRMTPAFLARQNAYFVGVCALDRFEAAEDKDVFTDAALQPTYLRASQAERERNEKMKGQRT